MNKLTLVLLVVCVGFAVIFLLKPSANFKHAPDSIQVERIDSTGAVVHETLHPSRARYLALYHGAGWCPPCQQFSPHLAEFYHAADKTKGAFQLVMVNYDRTDGEMLAYMRQHAMEFPAVMRASADAWGISTGNGIPNLMVVDTATGKVVSSSFNGDTYVGPMVPLEALKKIAE